MNGVLTVFRNRLVLLAKGDEGVALAISLAFMLPLFVLTICIYALQETMVRKAELQNAVDAAAYSAAVVQADYFSRFATVNKVLGWAYVQRERARADYALIQLCKKANDGLQRDLEACRANNARSCCSKHKRRDKEWGVGTMTSSSADGKTGIPLYSPREIVNIIKNGKSAQGNPLNQDTVRHYSYGNNVADPSRLTLDKVAAIAHTGVGMLPSKIDEYGETMLKCRATFDELKREFPLSVDHAARDILRLNLNQIPASWYSQVTVPKVDDMLAEFSCSEEDEKRLFEAAGLPEEQRTPQGALGLGADRFFVLGSKLRDFRGPDWLGRRAQRGYDHAHLKVWQTILILGGLFAVIAYWQSIPLWGQIMLAAFIAYLGTMGYRDRHQKAIDAQFADVNDAHADVRAHRCSCDGKGPCRVLNFENNKYLSMEWHFFWKRYAALDFKLRHFCIPPAKFLGQSVGGHVWGMSRASIYGETYGANASRQVALPGNPVVGKAIGASGRKLRSKFYSRSGSIRVIAARDNPNPLRLFGGGDSLKGLLSKVPGGKAVDLIKNYDAGGLYQIFNAHLSDNQALQFEKFEGSQCPNFLFAVAASRIALRPAANQEYTLRRPSALPLVSDCCTLAATDWEPFLVSFRGSNYEGWDKSGCNLTHPGGGGLLARLAAAAEFESEMRLGKWDYHPYKEVDGRGERGAPSDLKLRNADILVRLNDTRGPYPTEIERGSSLLFWGLANEYINH